MLKGVEKHVFVRRGSGTQGHFLSVANYYDREPCQCSVRNCRIHTAFARTQSVAGASSVHTLSASDIIASIALVRLDPLTAVSTLKTYTRFRKRVCAVQSKVTTTLVKMVRSAVAEWLSVAERRFDRSWRQVGTRRRDWRPRQATILRWSEEAGLHRLELQAEGVRPELEPTRPVHNGRG